MGTWLGIEATVRNVMVVVSALSGAPACPSVPGISDSLSCEERQAIVQRNKARYTPSPAEVEARRLEHVQREGARDDYRQEVRQAVAPPATMPSAKHAPAMLTDAEFEAGLAQAQARPGHVVINVTKEGLCDRVTDGPNGHSRLCYGYDGGAYEWCDRYAVISPGCAELARLD